MTRNFIYDKPFILESGETLPRLNIAYNTFGKLNADRSNAVWVMHALTADSDVADWWPHTVEKDKFLDPEKWFVVCANVLGSCYGTTGPSSINPETGQPYFSTFPDVTVRDMVRCHQLLAEHLGITQIDTIVGSSLGGFQAIEWLVSDPDIARRAILIATDFRCRPWLAAFNKAMYMAIEADPTHNDPIPAAGAAGLAAARAIGLLSYRGQEAFDMTQDEPAECVDPFQRRVHSYQAYQGKKLCDRFDAQSYLRMCRSADSHDVGRGRGGRIEALKRVKADCLVVAISSDILFPPSYHKEMAALIPRAQYREIDSSFAHDGFLIEHEKLNELIQLFKCKDARLVRPQSVNDICRLPDRKSPRFVDHDYSGGNYFVTVCTRDKKHYFGQIETVGTHGSCVRPQVKLSRIGSYCQDQLQNLSKHYPYAQVPLFIVMPNHIHAIISIKDGSNDGEKRTHGPCVPTVRTALSVVVGGLKRTVTMFAKRNNIEFAWQPRYHDHIIRNNHDGNNIANYIETNVARWDSDCYCNELKINDADVESVINNVGTHPGASSENRKI